MSDIAYHELVRRIHAEVDSTIDDMLNNPGNYYSLEDAETCMGISIEKVDRALIRKAIADRLIAEFNNMKLTRPGS